VDKTWIKSTSVAKRTAKADKYLAKFTAKVAKQVHCQGRQVQVQAQFVKMAQTPTPNFLGQKM
jgi:hypothetical protein